MSAFLILMNIDRFSSSASFLCSRENKISSARGKYATCCPAFTPPAVKIIIAELNLIGTFQCVNFLVKLALEMKQKNNNLSQESAFSTNSQLRRCEGINWRASEHV